MNSQHATPLMIVMIVGLFALIFSGLRRARSREEIHIRRISGVDAIDQALGRSAELGRPISFSTGLTTVSPTLYACLGVLFHVAKKAATYRSKLLLPQVDPQVMAISEDTVREAYREQGRANEFDPNNTRFLSEEQFAFASGYMGMVHRENIASAFLFGSFAAESLVLAEAGQQVGAMQVAACVSPEQVPFFISACDYTLIGEELYASSAYLTREPVQLGSLYAQDRAKLMLLIFIVVGSVWASAASIHSYLNSLDPASSKIVTFDKIIQADWSVLF